jgi:LCP family protein required for cell wall assembly
MSSSQDNSDPGSLTPENGPGGQPPGQSDQPPGGTGQPPGGTGQPPGGTGRRPGRSGQRPRPRRSRGRVVAAWVSAVVVAVLVAASLAVYLKYRAVWDSIRRVDVTQGELGRRPPQYTSALNLLVFASGSTAGLTRQQQLYWHVGADSGDAVSETIMIVHISPGRHRVTVVNIPRDTVVPVYACAKGPGWPGQQANPGAIEQIDNTLSYGGPACLWKTVEQQTGIRLDHFIEIGYPGLVNVVNDIGGVNVCVPVAVDDADSGLRLSQGEHHIGGVQFLEFWRTREKTGNGSDLQRIQRDDYLLAQTLRQVLHSGLLSSPTHLLRVISDAAGAMTTDSGLSQSDLVQIAQSLRGLSSGDYQFIQASNVLYPPNPNWVEFEQPQAHALFLAIAHDATPPKSARAAQHRHGGSAAGTASSSGASPIPRASSPPRPAKPAPRASSSPVGNLAHNYGGITGNASCTSDSSAFVGPLSP